ncbi:MAG: glycosyltransferase [bacterium]
MKYKRVLVTSCDLRFAEGAEGLLRSVRHCHPEVASICYVPLREVDALVARLGLLARVEAFPVTIEGVPDRSQVTVGRLFAVVPDADAVVYADADVVFCRPAPELWDIEPGKVNAVQDTSRIISDNLAGVNRELFVRQFPEVAFQKGANSGVLGLRPQDWKDLPQRFSDALVKGGFQYEPIIDQPMLNALFAPNFRWLPFEYNSHCLFDRRVPRNVRLVHFTGGVKKPWQPGFPKHEPAYWYWLKYGSSPRPSRGHLLLAALWIAVSTPKRKVGQCVRFLLGKGATH